MNGWTPEDFGPGQTGPQFQYLSDRLTEHGVPISHDLMTVRQRVQAWQLREGYRGTQFGQPADGFVGAVQLRQLKAPPVVKPVPGKINIPLNVWKWTSPVWDEDEESPMEVLDLEGFEMPPWFERTDKGSIVFRANAGGAHTENSLKARSELRQMTKDGKRAAWDSNDGKRHVMTGACRVLDLPRKVPSIVFGQCHDPRDDVFMLNAVGNEDRRFAKLMLLQSLGPGKGSIPHLLNSSYRLGDLISYRMEMNKEGLVFTYGGVTKIIPGRWLDCYWKAGIYLQTDTDKGERPDAIGAVEYEELDIFDLAA